MLGVLLVAVQQLGARQLDRRQHVLVGVEVGRAPTSPAMVPAPESNHSPEVAAKKDASTYHRHAPTLLSDRSYQMWVRSSAMTLCLPSYLHNVQKVTQHRAVLQLGFRAACRTKLLCNWGS